MDIVSLSPLQVGAVRWMPRQDAHALTLVCKATFELTPGRARLAPSQEPLHDDDRHLDGDPERSVFAPSDMAPFKRHADVLLVGDAYAPGGQPLHALRARLGVEGIDKSMEVVGDRFLDAQGELVAGEPFVRMPLSYERAAHSPHGDNPVGIDLSAGMNEQGRRPLPNLLPLGVTLQGAGDTADAVGFGPIASSWEVRRRLLGRHANSWSASGWTKQPLPQDVDGAYFNAAPPDQRLEELPIDARIVLENLHPTEERLLCQLPGIRPCAFVERAGMATEVELRADTLWIDTQRAICTLTWRGTVAMADARQRGRVLVAMAHPDQSFTWDDLRRMDARGPVVEEMTTDVVVPPGAQLPFERKRAPLSMPEHTAVAIPTSMDMGEALPAFMKRSEPQPPAAAVHAPAPPGWPGRPEPAHPPDVRPHPVGEAYAAPPPEAPELPSQTAAVPAAALDSSYATPPTEAAAPHDAVPAAEPAATSYAAPPVEPAATSYAAPPAEPAPVSYAAPPTPPGYVTPPAERGTPLSATQPAAQAIPSQLVELLWHDPTAPERARRQPPWSDLLAGTPTATATDQRHAALTLLVRGPVHAVETLQQAVADAVDERGIFEPPLTLLTGTLQMELDELARLGATVALAAAQKTASKELADSVEAARELLASPWRDECGDELARGLCEAVRAAFLRVAKLPDPAGIDERVGRALLERRRFRSLSILGSEHLGGQLSLAASQLPIPTYLPVASAPRLPLLPSLPVRLLARVHLQQDQREMHPLALEVLALGRLVQLQAPR